IGQAHFKTSFNNTIVALTDKDGNVIAWESNGVDLREPLNPAEPADSQAITFPSLSVSATIVLLKDVLMCAWPMAMFFLTRLRVRPLAACLRGGATLLRLLP